MTVSRVVIASVLVALSFGQGCASPPRAPAPVPRRGQLDEAMLRDTRECEAVAERLSGYSNTGVVGFWARVVAGYSMIIVIVAGTVAAGILALNRQSPQPSPTGSGSWTDLSGAIYRFVGSEPHLEDYLEKYRECMSARGYEVSPLPGSR